MRCWYVWIIFTRCCDMYESDSRGVDMYESDSRGVVICMNHIHEVLCSWKVIGSGHTSKPRVLRCATQWIWFIHITPRESDSYLPQHLMNLIHTYHNTSWIWFIPTTTPRESDSYLPQHLMNLIHTYHNWGHWEGAHLFWCLVIHPWMVFDGGLG